MAQNFDQAKRDNTFWTTPNILGGSVLLEHTFLELDDSVIGIMTIQTRRKFKTFGSA